MRIKRNAPPNERTLSLVSCRCVNYPAGSVFAAHQHANHQLIYASSGLLVISALTARWVVPPTRAVWMPAGTVHEGRSVSDVVQQNLTVTSGLDFGLPKSPSVVEVGPLLRELINAAERVVHPYESDSRDGRLMRFILDELKILPTLPLHLPRPNDRRIAKICSRIEAHPYENATLDDWGETIGVHPKTIQRVFLRDVGMTFGQWRQRARLLFALERLALGERVVDVSLDLGYDSPSAFSAMFRRHFRVAPSQFFG